ncbi:MAG: ATP-binding protein [Bacillota bacterium]|nr:ATP-binding protein [Bacillota bacterium]
MSAPLGLFLAVAFLAGLLLGGWLRERSWQAAATRWRAILEGSGSAEELEAPPAMVDLFRVARNRLRELAGEVERCRQRTHLLEESIRTLPTGLILVDREGRALLFNPALTELLGIARSRVQAGRPHIELLQNFRLSEMVDRVLEDGVERAMEVAPAAFRDRYLEARCVPLRAPLPEAGAGEKGAAGPGERTEAEGRHQGALLVLHDVSAIRRGERLRRDFVANVSHELRTPVTSILGFTETLLDGAIDDRALAREFVGIIEGEARRLAAMVEELLDLARLEAKQVELNYRTFLVADLVREVLDRFRPLASQRSVGLESDVDSSLQLEADRERVAQLLGNLVDNGIKYTPEGGTVRVRAQGASRQGKGGVLLVVEDTGRGIPSDQLDRIFERFYRVGEGRERPESQAGGSGLGLAIVKHIVEVHEGTVEVWSEPDRGSRFEVWLPAQAPGR